MQMWWNFANDVFHANLEAQRVMMLRLWKIAKGGPKAAHETRRMISEKLDGSTEASIMVATGGTPLRVMSRYRSLMRANESRLSRPRR